MGAPRTPIAQSSDRWHEVARVAHSACGRGIRSLPVFFPASGPRGHARYRVGHRVPVPLALLDDVLHAVHGGIHGETPRGEAEDRRAQGDGVAILEREWAGEGLA